MRIGRNMAAVAVRKTRTISAALVFVNLSFKVTVSNVTFYLLKLTTIYNFCLSLDLLLTHYSDGHTLSAVRRLYLSHY